MIPAGIIDIMNTLHNYLKKLTTEDQAKFAAACGTTIGYLRKAIFRKQSLGPKICVAIENHSNGKVTRESLHPDEYLLIWPELADKKNKQSKAA